MGTVLSYVLFSFACYSFVKGIQVLVDWVKRRMDHWLFFGFSMGSSIWSLCFGMLIVQTDYFAAYIWRSIGVVGVFFYVIFVMLLMVRWSGHSGGFLRYAQYFPIVGLFLCPLFLRREMVSFQRVALGMSYTLNSRFVNRIYLVYFLIICGIMFYVIYHMAKNQKRKCIRMLGAQLLFVVFLIIFGMLLDLILPMFGFLAFPGSTLAQFVGWVAVYRLLMFYERNRVDSHNMSQFVYYSVQTPVLVYDMEGKLQLVNKSAKDFFQLPEQYENISVQELFELDTKYTLKDVPDNPFKIDAKCLVNQAHCRVVCNKIIDKYQEVTGYIILVEDFTEKIHMIKELETARKQADVANRTKSAFLAQMSHEIRTPLNTILGMNEMILREDSLEKVYEYAHYVKKESHTLLNIINDILDLSKLEAGKIQVLEGEYQLRDVLADILNSFSLHCKEKGLKMEVNIPAKLPRALCGDSIRIKQVLTNVITNAIKYTEKGRVSFTMKTEVLSDDRICLIFQIRDTGRGIKEEDMDKIFAVYERIEEEQDRTIEGNGLGLAITKKLVELMHGEIQVESVYGEGSVFTITMEQEVLDPDMESSQDTTEPEESFVAPEARILVVDDMVSNLVVVQGLLKRTNIRVDLARSGQVAIRMYQKKKYQMVFLDHMMPEMDGIETLKRLKQVTDTENEDIPIIAMTANAVVGMREKYLEYGFSDYISKPIDYRVLEQMILKYLPEEMVTRVEIPPEIELV